MALGFLSGLVSGVANDLFGNLPTQITDIYSQQLPQINAPDVSFQPFTVTDGFGGSVTGGPGGTSYSLSPQQQAIANALQSSAFANLSGPTPGAAQSQMMGSNLMNFGANQFGQTPGQQAMLMGQQALGQTPFGLGGIQDASTQAMGLGSQFMQQAGMGTGERETEVYNRLRALQNPEEQRQQMALEERLQQQGRGGVATNLYGATPEQLVMQKARAEAQNTAALQAMQQAGSERDRQAALGAQYAGLGSSLAGQAQGLGSAQQQQALAALQAGQGLNAAQQQMAMQAMQGGQGMLAGGYGLEQARQQLGMGALQGSYAPQSALMSALSPALNIQSMVDVARRQQGEYGLEAQLANLQAQAGQQAGLAGLYGGLFSGASSLVGGLGSGLLGLAGDIFDF